MSQIAWDLSEVESQPSVATMGFFDGVHRGHATIIGRAVEVARERGLRAIAMTFHPHPMAVLDHRRSPKLLLSETRRAQAIMDCGVDLVVVLPFDVARALQAPEAFEDEVVAGVFDARHVVVGDNFTYGHQAAGTAATLAAFGARTGVDVEVHGLVDVEVEGEGTVALSSSLIRRRLLEDGDVAFAGKAMGRPFLLEGAVVTGDRRGRTIGFPTANVEVRDELLVPARGVYAGHASVNGEQYRMVTNIGTRPTFDGTGVTVEVHLLDAPDGLSIYGCHLEATFLHRLRPEQKFDGFEALVQQIGRDVERARGMLA